MGFLKSIFKPSPTKGSTHPQPLPPGSIDELDRDAPPRRTTRINSEDLHTLADILRESRAGDGGGTVDRLDRLKEVLEEIQRGKDGAEVTPYPCNPSQASRGKGKGKSQSPSESGASSVGAQVLSACENALETAEDMLRGPLRRHYKFHVQRIVRLLEAQRDEMIDLRPYTQGRRLHPLYTLLEIYRKVEKGLDDAGRLNNASAAAGLETLLQVLQEGPDYLIDIAIIEAVVWQAEVIDPSLGAEIRQVLDKAVAERNDLATFRLAAESIIAIISSMPTDLVDDTEAQVAERAIKVLLKQLQVRVASSRPPSRAPTATLAPGSSGLPSPLPTPVGSPLASPYFSASPTMSSNSSGSQTSALEGGSFERIEGPSLEERFGTGPMPSASNTPATSAAGTPAGAATPKPPMSPVPEGSEDGDTEEGSVWEYKGHLLTRSALDLVLRQEALAMADSSGQYVGDVSWDELRDTWIPAWARKLKPGDIPDGDVPDLDPANYVERNLDQWGNKIGWSEHGHMYFSEEPSFDKPA